MNRKAVELLAGGPNVILSCARRDKDRPCKCTAPFRIEGNLTYAVDWWLGGWNHDMATGNRENMRSIMVHAMLVCTGCGKTIRFGMESECSIQVLETELLSPSERWEVPPVDGKTNQ